MVLRIVGGGLMVSLHGWKKLFSGPERWSKLGSTLTDFVGMDLLSTSLGFLASFSESIGALLLIIGLYTRPAAALLAFTMLVAVLKKLPMGLKSAELPLLFFGITIAILLFGAGKISIDYFLKNKK